MIVGGPVKLHFCRYSAVSQRDAVKLTNKEVLAKLFLFICLVTYFYILKLFIVQP